MCHFFVFMRYKALIYVFRLFIAALHFNENGNKEQRQIKKGNDAGKLMWQVSYQKCRQLAGVIKCVKADSTYGNTHLHNSKILSKITM